MPLPVVSAALATISIMGLVGVSPIDHSAPTSVAALVVSDGAGHQVELTAPPVWASQPYYWELKLGSSDSKVFDFRISGLPSGLEFSQENIWDTPVISGTAHTAGSYPVEVRYNEYLPGQQPVAHTATVVLAVAEWRIDLHEDQLPSAVLWESYSYALPISLTSGRVIAATAVGLPKGLSIDNTGKISGYVQDIASGGFHITVTVTGQPDNASWTTSSSRSYFIASYPPA